ncbi:hypothetical protein [Pyrobaculum aerophilum]|uniref:Uncharacterized protein n=1 Tax=Pyrobaculum aerophilum TaxID=13773 RepID=A0A371QUR4_9CREN|nr:hypothetical protein [Pyrobaculum aerophilum]RFA93491.1 hypothetical protein CGL51_12820 [Pyrobaculum aerophilum]RFA95655.1 hypothetical protein CGL52_12575 [Pyrobaculum aerophilum]
MSCVDESTAEKIARKKALGRLGILRRSIMVFKVRVGEDWLFGYVKTKFKEEGFQIAVKLAYVDCKGIALEKIPTQIIESIREYIERHVAMLLERELSSLVK